MRKFIWILVLFVFACENEREITPDFEAEIQGDCQSDVLDVAFTNQSENATTYFWDFGDGTHSTDVNPVKSYAIAGEYTVTLTARNIQEQKSFSKEIKIFKNSDGEGPSGEFTAKSVGKNIFTYELRAVDSNASEYDWQFGDGSFETSGAQTVTHTFSGPGKYKIQLVCTNSKGSNCSSQTINIQP